MRIAVIGAGAIGGYYGGLLQASGQDVTFIARGGNLRTLRHHGLRVESAGAAPIRLTVKATDDPRPIGPLDLVLFTVKAYDTEQAAHQIPPLLAEGTAVLTLQNGVDNVDLLSEAVGQEHVLGGLCYILCTHPAAGVVRQTGGSRRVVLGELDGSATPRAQAAVDAFLAAGVPAELSRRILVDLWEKFIFINAQGGMTALMRVPIGLIRQIPDTFDMYLQVAEEAAAVGRAEGVPIPPGQRERVRQLAMELAPDSYSSLYYDLSGRLRTELEALLGTVVRLGQINDVPTPVSQAIYAALKPHDLSARR